MTRTKLVQDYHREAEERLDAIELTGSDIAAAQLVRCGECDQVIQGSRYCFICLQVLKDKLAVAAAAQLDAKDAEVPAGYKGRPCTRCEIEAEVPAEYDGFIRAATESPSGQLWRTWFDRVGEHATVDVVNATATLVVEERNIALAAAATQPATGRKYTRPAFHVDYGEAPFDTEPATEDDYLTGSCTESECRLCRIAPQMRAKGMRHAGISAFTQPALLTPEEEELIIGAIPLQSGILAQPAPIPLSEHTNNPNAFCLACDSSPCDLMVTQPATGAEEPSPPMSPAEVKAFNSFLGLAGAKCNHPGAHTSFCNYGRAKCRECGTTTSEHDGTCITGLEAEPCSEFVEFPTGEEPTCPRCEHPYCAACVSTCCQCGYQGAPVTGEEPGRTEGQPFKEFLAEQMRDPEFAEVYREVSAVSEDDAKAAREIVDGIHNDGYLDTSWIIDESELAQSSLDASESVERVKVMLSHRVAAYGASQREAGVQAERKRIRGAVERLEADANFAGHWQLGHAQAIDDLLRAIGEKPNEPR